MKYILLIFLICFSLVSDVFAQKNSPITRSGKEINSTGTFSNKLVDAIPNGAGYKPSTKTTPVINAENTLFYESFDNVPGDFDNGNRSFPTGWLRFNVDGGTPASEAIYINKSWIRREDFK